MALEPGSQPHKRCDEKVIKVKADVAALTCAIRRIYGPHDPPRFAPLRR
jgi:hypothetical protein